MKQLKKICAVFFTIIMLFSIVPIAAHAEWKSNTTGWWYTEGSSWSTGWRQIDGNWYYFYSNGYMAHDTIIDGHYVNSSGVWTKGEWKSNSTGWWYIEGNSWATGWRNIDGNWYYFYSNGYMAHDTTVDGCYVDSNGIWRHDENNNSNRNSTTNSLSQAAGSSALITANGDSEKKSTETDNKNGKTIVVYYSATGSTEKVADTIAEVMNADIFKIEPTEPYTDDDLDWTDDNSRVVREHDNADNRNIRLNSTKVNNWSSYDTVFIGYPIWWGEAAWPIDEFIKSNDFSGKTVIPFCTSTASDMGESGELLAKMAGTGNWLEGKRFRSGASLKDIQEWTENFKK